MKRLFALVAVWVLFVPAASGARAAPILVAVVDSGIDRGAVDEWLLAPGHNVMDGSGNTQDDFGHGTGVAYTLGQALSIAREVSGICHECRLMPVKIAGASGVATFSATAAGIEWAADHGARVINLQLRACGLRPAK